MKKRILFLLVMGAIPSSYGLLYSSNFGIFISENKEEKYTKILNELFVQSNNSIGSKTAEFSKDSNIFNHSWSTSAPKPVSTQFSASSTPNSIVTGSTNFEQLRKIIDENKKCNFIRFEPNLNLAYTEDRGSILPNVISNYVRLSYNVYCSYYNKPWEEGRCSYGTKIYDTSEIKIIKKEKLFNKTNTRRSWVNNPSLLKREEELFGTITVTEIQKK